MSEAIAAPAAPSTDSARLWYAEALRETLAEHTGDPKDEALFVLDRPEVCRAFQMMLGREPSAYDATLHGRTCAMRSAIANLHHSATLAQCDAAFVGSDDAGREFERAAKSLAAALCDLDRAAALLRRAEMQAQLITDADRAVAGDPRA